MKIDAATITIGFSEHPNHKQPKIFSGANVWTDTQRYLSNLAAVIPDDLLGYYKTDFVIEWQDGTSYAGRLDLKPANHSAADHYLRPHILRFAQVYSGRQKPSHLTDEQYRYLLGTLSSEDLAYYGNLLDRYALTCQV
jgi:hypothetical protein